MDAWGELQVLEGHRDGHPSPQLLAKLMSHSAGSEELYSPNLETVSAVLVVLLLGETTALAKGHADEGAEGIRTHDRVNGR